MVRTSWSQCRATDTGRQRTHRERERERHARPKKEEKTGAKPNTEVNGRQEEEREEKSKQETNKTTPEAPGEPKAQHLATDTGQINQKTKQREKERRDATNKTTTGKLELAARKLTSRVCMRSNLSNIRRTKTKPTR